MSQNLFGRDPRLNAADDILGSIQPRGMGVRPDTAPAPAQAPEAPAAPTIKDFFEQVSSETTAPVNLVWALGERLANTEEGVDQDRIRQDAAFVAGRMANGDSLEDALQAITNDRSEAAQVAERVYAIADEVYPSADQIADDEARNDNMGITDTALTGLGAFASGAGMAVEGIGGLIGAAVDGADEMRGPRAADSRGEVRDAAGDIASGTLHLTSEALEGVGGWLSGLGENTQGQRSDAAIEAEQAMMSAFENNEVDWDDITLEGAGLAAVNLFGTLAPIVVTGFLSGGMAAAAAGAGQSFADGGETGRQAIMAAFEAGELQETEIYQRFVDQGYAPMEARDQVAAAAEQMAGVFAAPIGAIGGKITFNIAQRGIATLSRQSAIPRILGTAAVAGAEEGTQEVAEGVAARLGAEVATDVDTDLTDDMLGNFVMGGMAGAPIGALGARRRAPGEVDGDTPLAPPAPAAAPNAAPAPTRPDMQPAPAIPASTPVPPPTVAPQGPLEAAVADLPIPEPEAPIMFPDMKPGQTVDLVAPDGRNIQAVFQREADGGVVVRYEGQEIPLTPQEFDVARAAANPPAPENGQATPPAAPTEDSGAAARPPLSDRLKAAMQNMTPPDRSEDRGPQTVEQIDQIIANIRNQATPGNGDMTPAMSRRIADLTTRREKLVAEQADTPDLVDTSDTSDVAQQVEAEALVTDTDPTEGQKEAGNYRKGRFRWNGFEIAIENPKGSTRSKKGRDGNEWSVVMPAHYGDLKRTTGADGDNVDVYMGPNPESDQVFIVDQVDADSRDFDEHKVMLGMGSEAEARATYEAGFSDGRGADRLGGITAVSVDDFKEWVKNGDTAQPYGNLVWEGVEPEPAPEPVEEDDTAQPDADTDVDSQWTDPSVEQEENSQIVDQWDGMTANGHTALLIALGGFTTRDGELTRGAKRAVGRPWQDISDAMRTKIETAYQNYTPPANGEAEATETATETAPAPIDPRARMDAFIEKNGEGHSVAVQFKVAKVDDLSRTAPGIRYMNRAAKLETVAERRAAADDFIREMVKKSPMRETAVLLDADGMPVAIIRGQYSKKGGGHAVGFPIYVQNGITAGEVTYATHNHPSDSGLSGADLRILPLAPSGLDIVAIGNTKGRHEAKLGDVSVDAETFALIAYDADRAAYAVINPDFMADKITADDANFIHRALVSLALDRVGLINYTGSATDLLSITDRGYDAEAIVSAAAEAARDGLRRAGLDVPDVGSDGADRDAGSPAEPDVDADAGNPAPEGNPADDDGAGRLPESGQGLTTYSPQEQWDSANPSQRQSVFTVSGWVDPDSGSLTKGAKTNVERDYQDLTPKAKLLVDETLSDASIGMLIGDAAKAERARRDAVKAEQISAEPVEDPDFDGALDDMFGAPERTAEDIANDMKAILNGLKEEPGAYRDEQFKKLKPLFTEALANVDTANLSRRETFTEMMRPLVAAGLTRDDVKALQPFFTRYLDEQGGAEGVDPEAGSVEPETQSVDRASDSETITMAFRQAFAAGEEFDTIVVARKRAGEALGRKVEESEYKMVEEAIEAAVVQTARDIATSGDAPDLVYDQLVDLYAAQPILAQRTSSSIERQAYSTPAPLAYIASRRAGVADAEMVVEPSAGTGMLLIEGQPGKMIANEIDPERADMLRQTFGNGATITQSDATTMDLPASVPSIIMNPPFGAVFEGRGRKSWPLGVTTTNEIDHAIAWRSLEAMADDGSAVLILGGVKKQASGDARKKGYQTKAKRAFYKQLYDSYNVVDHFTVDGDLYKRQGAAWPVDVVVIKGKGASSLPMPMAQAPEILSSWDSLKGKLDDVEQSADVGPARNQPDADGSEPAEVSAPDDGGLPQRDVDAVDQDVRGSAEPGGDGGRPDGDGREADVEDAGSDGGRVSSDERSPDSRDAGAESEVAGPAQRPEAEPGVEGADRGNDAGIVPGRPLPDRERLTRDNQEVETGLQKRYEPRSNARFSVGALVPNNMRSAVQKALDTIEAEHGDIDDFVANALGWTRDEMLGTDDAPGYFSAEQADAAAMAIYNAEKGKGFIIGDQTGVGKGRFVAAMLRYADRKGYIPLFISQQPNLYADMIRDLEDIGETDVVDKIVVTNSDLRGSKAIPVRQGSDDVIQSLPKAKLDKMLRDLSAKGTLPEGKKYLFTTYDQMTARKGEWPLRANALLNASGNLFAVLDESHTAGGTVANSWAKKRGPDDPPVDRSEFFRDLVRQAAGSVFSSATYAKNPTVMSLYNTTDLALTVDDINDLSDAVTAGGVPLQQVLANQLVEAGQFARREKSYDGIEFASSVAAVDPKRATTLSATISEIFDFDENMMTDVRDKTGAQVAEDGAQVMPDGAIGTPSVTSTNFASSLHNIVSQMLFSLKADLVVEQAIAAHKEGRKPVIAVTNTNGAILTQQMADQGLDVGDQIDLPFKALLQRYLERLRMVNVKEIDGKSRKIRLTDAQIGTTAAARFRELSAQIDAMDIGELSGNPLDTILDRLRDAGLKTGEITGRQRVVENGVIAARDSSQSAKKKVMQDFNSGAIDAILLNKSGSTGFSMHATNKADNDGKPRHMMVMQADPNIDVFMQMLGRINRTGQTELPTYDLIATDMAVERRPKAILTRKMASLNANTTASKEGVVSIDNVVDFLNVVGDKVVAEYLKENPDIAEYLNIEVGDSVDNLAQRVTGRMVVLDPAKAEDIYGEIESRYEETIAELDRLGQNPLEAKTLDLDARTISRSVLREGGGTGSPLDQDTIVTLASVKKLGRSMTYDQAKAEADKARAGRSNEALATEISEAFDSRVDAHLERFRDRIARKKAALAEIEATESSTDTQITNAKAEVEKAEAALSAEHNKIKELRGLAMNMVPGQPVMIESPTMTTEAVVLNVDLSKMGNNPAAGSTVKIRFAVADAAREISLPLSRIRAGSSEVQITSIPEEQARIAFESGQSESREERTIITGNMIDGFARFEKGQVIMFTDDSGNVQPGILMPTTFNLKRELEAKPVRFATAGQIIDFFDRVPRGMIVSEDGLVAIARRNRGYVLTVKRKNGKPYYLNNDVRAAVGDFGGRSGSTFEAVADDQAALTSAVQAWMGQIGAVFQAENHKDEARAITGEDIPDMKAEVGKSLNEAAIAFREDSPRWGNVPTGPRAWISDQKKLAEAAISDVLTDKSAALLSVIPGRALFTELGRNLPSARKYVRMKEEMDALRQDWQARAANVTSDWLKTARGNPEANESLMDLMHSATLSGIDPSKPSDADERLAIARKEMANSPPDSLAYKSAQKTIDQDAARRRDYAKLRAQYDALPTAFQHKFSEVANTYNDMGDQVEAAVIENMEQAAKIATKRAERTHKAEMRRIKDEGLKGDERQEAVDKADAALDRARARSGWALQARLASLRQQFESNRLTGPYFPLARFGDFYLTVRDSDGKVISFSRFKKSGQQKKAAREAAADPMVTVEVGVLSDPQDDLKSKVDPAFVADVQALLGDFDADPVLMDSIWQRWLETLPDNSLRTNHIHRKGRKGFSKDAVRAFTSHTFHGAHQLARLKYGLKMQDTLDDVKDEAKAQPDPNRAGMIAREMGKRHDFTMLPTGSAWSAKATGAAFVMYLGLTPAAAMVNVSQTTIVAPAILGARFRKVGASGAVGEIARAAKDFLGTAKKSEWKEGFATLQRSKNLSKNELAAMEEGYRRGTIDKTQAHELPAVAETGIEYNDTRERVMKVISYQFHHAERANREVTFLAAYRMATKDGIAHDEAIEVAADLTWKSHFDYQNTSRPRIMQGDVAKVLTVFRQFTINMLYRAGKDLHTMTTSDDPELRREARYQFAAISLSMFAHAGIKGVWGYGILKMLFGFGANLLGFEDDDDLDAFLQHALLFEGESAAATAWNMGMGMVLNGAPGQITGWNLSERIGMPNLWFRENNRRMEAEEWYWHMVEEMLGPVVGIGAGIARGITYAADGDYWRGAETAVPKVVRDAMRAGRYTINGVTTRRGDELLDDVGLWQALSQGLGFTPAQIAERYEVNSRMMNRQAEITERRSGIQQSIRDSIIAGDGISERDMERMMEFNREFPEYPITNDTLRQSIRSKLTASARNEFGIQLNPRLNRRIREEQPPMIYN